MTEQQKISEITPEQKAQFPAIVDKWIKIGLSTERANRAVAEKAVCDAYEVAGVKPPKHLLWVESPQAGVELYCKLMGERTWIVPFYGQHDAGWFAFYEAFELLGVDVSKLNPLKTLSQNCGWVWMFENAAILTERPTKIALNERNELHCVDGKAIDHADGWGLYAYNGTIVPERLIMNPESYTREEILKIENTEIVRALAEVLTWEKYLKILGVKVIDTWTDPATDLKYELLESTHRHGDREPRFIRKQSSVLKDGSQPWYIEPVHPELKTAAAARKFQAMAAFVTEAADNQEQMEAEYEKIMVYCNKNTELEYNWER